MSVTCDGICVNMKLHFVVYAMHLFVHDEHNYPNYDMTMCVHGVYIHIIHRIG